MQDLKDFPELEQLKCPRCESPNTKFCYYNNYNLSQPRHFCKSCRRYWTKGGTLRNVPVGGGSRKRNSPSSPPATAKRLAPSSPDPDHTFLVDPDLEQQVRTVQEQDGAAQTETQCWTGNNTDVWPGLSIYTPPGSTFH